MSARDQLIAIAESVGWVSCRPCAESICGVAGYSPSDPFPHDNGEQSVPDFLNDLNAMHLAVLSLEPFERSTYTMALRAIVVRDATPEMHDLDSKRLSDLFFYEATAAQRAEAFLTAKGKRVAA